MGGGRRLELRVPLTLRTRSPHWEDGGRGSPEELTCVISTYVPSTRVRVSPAVLPNPSDGLGPSRARLGQCHYKLTTLG